MQPHKYPGRLHNVSNKIRYLYSRLQHLYLPINALAFASHFWQFVTSISNHISEMALKTSATPYIALLSLMVAVVPGIIWLYRKMLRPRKRGESDRQEIRSSATPKYHNVRRSSPAYFYFEESRCRKAWILLQGVPANTPYQVSPTLPRMPSHTIAALDYASQVVSLGTRFLNGCIHLYSS